MKRVSDSDQELKGLKISKSEVISEPSYFPQEVWEKIIQFIPLHHRFRLEAVCKRWKELMPYSDVKEVTIPNLHGRRNDDYFFENILKSVLPRYERMTSISVSKGIPLHISISLMRMIKERCAGLEKLALKSCIIKDSDVFNHIPATVRHLGLPGIPVGHGDNNDICLLYRQGLSDLLQAKPDLLSLHLDGFLTGTVINLPNLLSLSIDCETCRGDTASKLTSNDLDRICQDCPSLQELDVSVKGFELNLGTSIGQLVHLRSLSLKNVFVTKEALQALYSNCTDLNRINFTRCELAHRSRLPLLDNRYMLPPLVKLEPLSKLAVLIIDECTFHDAIIRQMVQSGNLREIIINGCSHRVSFATMVVMLQANPFLENVKACCSAGGMVDFTDILQAGLSLRSLYLELFDSIQLITVSDSDFIRPLQELTLKRASISADAIRALAKICPEMRELDLQGSNLVVVDSDIPKSPMFNCHEIIEDRTNFGCLSGICQGTKLQNLSLEFNHWKSDALTSITGCFPELRSLRILGNRSGIKVEDVACALEKVPGLQKLVLRGVKWDLYGESDFAGAIADHGRSLTSLNVIDYNFCSDLVCYLAVYRREVIDSGVGLPCLEVMCGYEYALRQENEDLFVAANITFLS